GYGTGSPSPLRAVPPAAFSSSRTTRSSTPLWTSRRAALKPATPAPMMATSMFCQLPSATVHVRGSRRMWPSSTLCPTISPSGNAGAFLLHAASAMGAPRNVVKSSRRVSFTDRLLFEAAPFRFVIADKRLIIQPVDLYVISGPRHVRGKIEHRGERPVVQKMKFDVLWNMPRNIERPSFRE